MERVDPFETFCSQLSNAIRRSPYSRVELAEKLGVKPATIKSWCVGRRSPTVQRMLELCQALDLEPGELFTQPEAAPERTECPACNRSFRRHVGYRIHVALKAREDEEHRQLHDLEEQNAPSGIDGALELVRSAVGA